MSCSCLYEPLVLMKKKQNILQSCETPESIFLCDLMATEFTSEVREFHYEIVEGHETL